MTIQIREGGRIAVIGGGPAGSMFSIFLLRHAKQLSKNIEVVIFEKKDFSNKGQRGCNKCAGVIQYSLSQKLLDADLALTDHIIRSRIDGYKLWMQSVSANIKQGREGDIATVFRGGGPVHSIKTDSPEKTGFDSHLLKNAETLGVQVIHEPVNKIDFGDSTTSLVKVYYGNNNMIEADLVVSAAGVNSSTVITGLPKTYSPPKTWQAFQAEIPIEEGDYTMKLIPKNLINVFFIKPRGVKYIAAIPKGNYLSVSVIGKYVDVLDLKASVSNSKIGIVLPSHWKIKCFCHPRIPSSPAKGAVSDRFIAIGDAAYSRWLKNGIESAYYTAMYAAEAALMNGISAEKLNKFYIKKCRKRFVIDNLFGKLIFFMHDLVMTTRLTSYTYMSLLNKEQAIEIPEKRRLSQILWHLYTGDEPYMNIFIKCLNPMLQIRLFWETIITAFRREDELIKNNPSHT